MEYDTGKMMTCRRPLDVVMGKNYSIFNQCRECRGWEADPVEGGTLNEAIFRCEATECPLWEHRLPKSQIRKKNGPVASIERFENEGIPLPTPLSNVAAFGPKNDSVAAFGRSTAINRFCRYCMCIEPKTDSTPIKECVSPQCWLWPHRQGA